MRNLVIVLWVVLIGCGKVQGQVVDALDSIKSRIAPSLRSNKYYSQVLVQVTDGVGFEKFAKKTYPEISIQKAGRNIFILRGLNIRSQGILKHSEIKFIDRANRTPEEETVLGDFDLALNAVRKSHEQFSLINGDGLTISIKEKPFHQDDIDLKGRISLNKYFDEAPSLHATLMATIAGGGGNTSPFARGVAWGADLTSSDFERLLPDDPSELIQFGVTVQNHSYGVGVENYYGIESKEYDLQCNQFPEIVHVFSSGNRGDETISSGAYANIPGVANLTGQFKVSKNTIAVGSSDRFGNVVPKSSRGPAYDGRVKPELIAYGDAGSSDAAAVVSGIAGLLQHAYRDLHGELPDAALVRAILFNSAKDTGRPYVDFETGFGNANSLGALRTITEGRFFSGFVSQDDLFTAVIDVSSGVDQVKVTLAWNDPPADPFSDQALVNDLDLTVRHLSTNQVWNPWVLDPSPSAESLTQNSFRGKDRLNNVEQFTLDAPAPGTYELIVEGFSISGNQKFFIAYEMNDGFEWTYPSSVDALSSNSLTMIRWETLEPGSGVLSYKFQNETEWIVVDEAVDLSKGYYEWITPDTSALVQLRLIVNSENFDSPLFPVSVPQRLGVGFNCDDEILVHWKQVPEADEFVVYSLGEKYLEPLLVTEDTFSLISKSSLLSEYLSFAPVFSGIPGYRELTVNYQNQGTGCYFVSFLPKQFVTTGEAIFDALLGTVYNLKSASLEKLVNGSFEEVELIATIPNRAFSVIDPSPTSGVQTYRLKLTTFDGQTIYSDEVELFYVRENDLHVFPNPVVAGEDLNIVVSTDDIVDIYLFSLSGGYAGFTQDFGTFKVLNTGNLPKGGYALRVVKNDGTVLIKKFIII